MTETTIELASLKKRLGAANIDVLIAFSILIAIAMITGFWDNVIPRLLRGILPTVNDMLIVFLSGQVVFLLLNGMLLANYGQTIGKRLMKIKIVDLQGDQVGISKLYFLRYLFFSLVSQVPQVGGLIGLVDILFIFGKERRCLHDLLAGTRVVNVV